MSERKVLYMIYLDNAATTFPKPPEVAQSVYECINDWCGNPGRGSHSLAARSSAALYECREEAASLFGLEDCGGAALFPNATYALNSAIFGLVEPGSHVVISDMEHNSVLRPVEFLKRERGVTYDVFSTCGDVTRSIKSLLRPNTAAVICLHASNIINRVLPIGDIGRLCGQRGILFILDASQSAGTYDINMRRDGISVRCTAGHKGLLGPQGSGLALYADGIVPKPFTYGGSGINSIEKDMPAFLPDRLEAGTAATPAAVGLACGIRYVRRVGVQNIARQERCVSTLMHKYLSQIKGVKLYSSPGGALCLFNVDGVNCQECAAMLDSYDICVRAGLHCAPLAHKTAGTLECGAVRASAGPFSSADDAAGLAECVEKIARGCVK